MNIVDSSAWLEYFAGTKDAQHFVKAIEDTASLVVPAIVLYEVFKKILQERDETTAMQIVAHMKLAIVIDLDLELALASAKISKEYQLPMADSIILATAHKTNAIVWTLDADFKGLPRVKYFRKT